MSPSAPTVDCERQHAGLAVPDLMKAVDFYTTKLGFTLGFTWGEPPTFAGVNFGEQQVFLQPGTPSPEGCSIYFVVDKVDELYQYHLAGGVTLDCEVGDREYGLRDYGIRDLNGYRLVFGQPTYRMGPPIEIERADVPVRLEKRIAAVLQDLAAYKGMTISSCLEETLLHTWEPLGDGVASPHTKADLRKIQQLKQEHGIDYDSHGSYRFVERAR